ncbi:uncharacterized protein Z520_02013 [Fonsecaea multimorphosa CBS 102226]|uniref:Uncharacterized protein n=1 Tax=Fonsecaea multimorphosa CBS 102226 TaxID=1442371 RepID=A0A0D2KEV8_9EURO|nr:uncharacterized protein Z520_02013 [Fonsecaea multimorphosa CBS 102226]KIY01875.1 hypothetical protein Z520_02013 [Fonsecaea multimorphosa CBS 102226]
MDCFIPPQTHPPLSSPKTPSHTRQPTSLTDQLTLLLCIEDQRSIANRLAASGPQNTPSNASDNSSSGKPKSAETRAAEVDATAPARMHGNEPSRGAQIDKELQDEEAAILAKKDAAKGGNHKGGTGDVAGKKN